MEQNVYLTYSYFLIFSFFLVKTFQHSLQQVLVAANKWQLDLFTYLWFPVIKAIKEGIIYNLTSV